MKDLSNNLFNYATKELSQDAFICWLCSYALEGKDSVDGELASCAQRLICTFLERGTGKDIICPEVHLREVEKQVGNIDVLLTAEYLGEIYKIIIEDKVHASEHDNQLKRYKDQFSDDVNVIGIYYKTGFQSNLSEVNKAGYVYFGRCDILETLKRCSSENAIFQNYREYWENFEEKAQSYKVLPIEKWPDWQAVNGFYDEMQSILEEKEYWAGYDYVSNQSGGFWGLWYGDSRNEGIEINSFKAAVYFQVESKWNYDSGMYDIKICMKLKKQSDDTDESETDKIWDLRKLIVDNQADYGFEKPSRLGYGQHMTVGIYKKHYKNKLELQEAILSAMDSGYKLVRSVEEKMRSNL